jgi:hypothetical protein
MKMPATHYRGSNEKLILAEALKLNACSEDIDYKSSRGLDQSVMMKLTSCDWIRRHQNIIITGLFLPVV